MIYFLDSNCVRSLRTVMFRYFKLGNFIVRFLRNWMFCWIDKGVIQTEVFRLIMPEGASFNKAISTGITSSVFYTNSRMLSARRFMRCASLLIHRPFILEWIQINWVSSSILTANNMEVREHSCDISWYNLVGNLNPRGGCSRIVINCSS